MEMNKKLSSLWWKIGLIVIVLSMLGIAFLMIMGPMVGNVFSTINTSLASYSYAPKTLVEQPAGNVVDAVYKNAPEEVTERLIIREGTLVLVVKDTLASQKEIEKIVSGMANDGAFVVSNSADSSGIETLPNVHLVIRIPVKRFDEVMNRIAGMAVEIRQKTATAQDVTADYVDVKARVEALEAAHQRLLQIMKDSTTTESLLLAEKELTQRESDLEALKGRMQYLSESARLSSITIDLSPDALSQPLDSSWRPSETVRNSFDALVNGLKAFADFLIFFTIAILPWLVFLYGIYWLVQKWRARKRKSE